MTDLNSILKPEQQPVRDTGNAKRIALTVGSILLVVVTIGGIIYFVIKQNPDLIGLSKDENSVTQSPQEELNQTIEKVGKLMLLPNEIPTLATVSDLSKLSGQQFFVNAKIGDKVLVYQKAQKAILYRPSEDKIIEVGTVSVEDVTNQEAQPEVNTPTPTVQVITSPTPSTTENITPTIEPTLTPTVTVTPTATQ